MRPFAALFPAHRPTWRRQIASPLDPATGARPARRCNWPAVGRIHRVYRARVWRRRWIIGLLVAVVLVLLGLGLAATWRRMNAGGTPARIRSL